MIFFLLSLINTNSNLKAGDKIVTLPSGKTLIAKTLFNTPIHYHNEYLRVTELRPVLGKLQDPRIDRMAWTIKIALKERRMSGFISIESPMYPTNKAIIPIWANTPHGYASEGVISEFFNKDTYPILWNFLATPEDSWIPFEIHASFTEPKADFSFIEWAHITQNEKRSFLKYETDRLNAINKFIPQTITLSDGKIIEIKLDNNMPIRYADSLFQVDNLSPAYDGKNKEEMDPWFWFITGYSNCYKKFKLEILSPTTDDKCLATVDIKGYGPWSVAFGNRSEFPEFWNWVNKSENQWVVVKVRLTDISTKSEKEWFEGCLIDDKVRKLFYKFN